MFVWAGQDTFSITIELSDVMQESNNEKLNNSDGAVGGHVSPMAVMVAPTRIDYSVTKGGLRTWAVLFVFIFLCSSLYTIFSAKDLTELVVGESFPCICFTSYICFHIDGDGIVDLDEEIESGRDADADEVATQYRRATKDRTPSRENIVHSAEEVKRIHQKMHTAPSAADDDIDEDEDDEHEEEAKRQEETLLAGLKAKIEAKKRQKSPADRKRDDMEREDANDDEEASKAVPTRQVRRKHRRSKRYEDDDDDEAEKAEPQDETTIAAPTRKGRRRKQKHEERPVEGDESDESEAEPLLRQRRKHKRPSDVVDEDADEDVGDESEEAKQVDEPDQGDGQEDKGVDESEADDQDQSDEETVDEDAEKVSKKEDSEAEEVSEKVEHEAQETQAKLETETQHETEAKPDDETDVKQKPRRKRKRTPAAADALKKPARLCKRKYCPPVDNRTPRMELLKQKPQTTLSRRNKRYVIKPTEEEDLEDFDEFGNGDESDLLGDGVGSDEDDEEGLNEVIALKKDRLNSRATYKRRAITNHDDLRFRDQLDRADQLVEKHEYRAAFAIFDDILRYNPDSPRAHFGKARAFDIRSEMDADKTYLDMAINEYQEVLNFDDTPDTLFRQAANRLVDRARFRGALHKALVAQRSLIDRYPEEIQLQNDFGLTFLMMGRHDDALKVFEDVLQVDPNNGVAQAYYGYLMKMNGQLEQGVIFMRKGLRAARAVIADPRFYYHLGDALTRLGRKDEAFGVYSIAAKIGLFLSPYQRSIYNYDGLTARPWWTLDQTTYSRHLKNVERQWTIIREEALKVLERNPELYLAENKQLTIGGQWLAFTLFYAGSWNKTNCHKMPKTCDILKDFKESSNSTKNQVYMLKISLLTSGTRVWPHCGYSNCRLQAHLGLVVPSEARIRVADETRGWKTGRFIIFDDSYEHEMWFDGASANKMRLVLSIYLWHPEIDSTRRYEFNTDF
ncbi:unnamed protein product [Anisakis simplex]|uniref:Aspartyl/asparaginyl beta-hydroxylase (inferred by orthology to a human protein) n=1 Tax=Anisakis simplex TaxID=6269 RepID=A0A0M3K016_ANISI|nr:unnamed protein product [Anisakis simplex]